MGLTLAFPAAVPQDAPGEEAQGRVEQIAPSDGELIQRVGSRDAGAFELLYRRYARPVFGLALRRLGDRMAAEEAVQETFAALWRSARTYRPERGPGAPWLYAVARNAIVDRARNKSEPTAEVPETASPELGPEDRAEASYVSWRVHRALEDLPRNERDVLELAYWGGLSQREVADFLGIPLGTVKTRTRAGLGRLATALGGEFR
jgi:RNA polymerase sigma-70 factor (ECF subfamily)